MFIIDRNTDCKDRSLMANQHEFRLLFKYLLLFVFWAQIKHLLAILRIDTGRFVAKKVMYFVWISSEALSSQLDPKTVKRLNCVRLAQASNCLPLHSFLNKFALCKLSD
jgi:hypothetical protein